VMSFIAVDREGRHAGFSNSEDATYLLLTDAMAEPEERKRTYVPTKRQWQTP